MPASTRTQIYLTDAQRKRLDEICRTRGIALAVAVREAIDAWIEMRHASCSDALAATWGQAPLAQIPSRDEWDAASAADVDSRDSDSAAFHETEPGK